MNEKRINADGLTMRQVAEYKRKGYALKLTDRGWGLATIFKCGHCDHKGVRAGNGYSTWCANCGMNNRLTKITENQP